MNKQLEIRNTNEDNKGKEEIEEQPKNSPNQTKNGGGRGEGKEGEGKESLSKVSNNIIFEIEKNKRKTENIVKIESKDGSGHFFVSKQLYETNMVNKKNFVRPKYSSALSSTNLDNEKDEIVAHINNQFVIPNSFLIISLKLISTDKNTVFTLLKTKIKLFDLEDSNFSQPISKLILNENKLFVTKDNHFYLAFKIPPHLSNTGKKKKFFIHFFFFSPQLTFFFLFF